MESNPLRPLITPARKLDFIIVYEASSDAPNSWNNGSNPISKLHKAYYETTTNMADTARAASQGDIPFPKIPDVNTIVAQNLSFQPTFFGCNASEDTPLLLWLPNAPWTGYTNYSYTQSEFTSAQLNITFENAFQIATYGNGSVDENWPACLACAAIKGSLRRVDMDMPKQCDECFNRHCWNGTTSSKKATAADFDLRPRLEPNLNFKEWNDTDWSSDLKKGGSGGSSGSGNDDNSAGVRMSGSVIGLVLSAATMAYFL